MTGVKFTDTALLGSATMAGITGMVHSYAAFAVTAASALLLGIIRWQQHKQKMRHEEIIFQKRISQLDKNQ